MNCHTHLIYVAPVIQNAAAKVGQAGEGTGRKYAALHVTGVVMATVLVPRVPDGLSTSGGDAEGESPGWVCGHGVCPTHKGLTVDTGSGPHTRG